MSANPPGYLKEYFAQFGPLKFLHVWQYWRVNLYKCSCGVYGRTEHEMEVHWNEVHRPVFMKVFNTHE